MRRFLKVAFRAFLVLVPLALGTLAVVLSYDAACAIAPPLAGDAMPMKGIAYRCYGSPDVLKLEQLEKPVPAEDQVLVKVHAAAINPLDVHFMRGTPYITRLVAGIGRPVRAQLGMDFSGTVEAVGSKVTRFKPGDEVFGGRFGSFAEYIAVPEGRAIAHKPANLSFVQAAVVPVAAVAALQALRDEGQLQAGQEVLINGASGGVGTFAVQIAKIFGAEVTGVCSTRNVEMVRRLGADHVIDYTQRNFTEASERYDLIIDMVGSHGLLDYRRVLKPTGRLVIVGGPDGKWVGFLAAPLRAIVLSPFVEQQMGMMMSSLNQADLVLLGEWMQAGKVTPVIDRAFSLEQVPEAIRYLEQGRARGKVVIQVLPEPGA